MNKLILMIVTMATFSFTLRAEPAAEVNGLPLLFHEDFKDPQKGLSRFQFDDPAAWSVTQDEGRNVLSLTRQSKYKPPVRTPVNRALVKDLWVGAFVMDVKLRSTVKDYGHRDLCLFFGSVDESHQFYVHLGKVADPHCNNIFLVDGKDRVAVASKTTKGTDWTDKYHTARIVRKEGGEVEVFFDGVSVMATEKKEFPVGRLGVGTFDDLGNYAEITVWGKKMEKPAGAK